MTLALATRAALRRDLARDEGRVRHVYKDSLGYLTVGVGRLVDQRKGGGLRESEIDFLLDNDIDEAIEDVQSLPAWQAVKNDPVRSRALLNMRFQLGADGLRGFRNSLAMIASRDWARAGANLRASKWYRQTPQRAERVIRMIETGVAP